MSATHHIPQAKKYTISTFVDQNRNLINSSFSNGPKLTWEELAVVLGQFDDCKKYYIKSLPNLSLISPLYSYHLVETMDLPWPKVPEVKVEEGGRRGAQPKFVGLGNSYHVHHFERKFHTYIH